MALSVTKHIYQQLSTSEALTSVVKDRIYPVYVPNGTPAFPLVIFDTQTGQPDYTKDGLAADHHTVVVNVLAREYMQELLPAAESARKALELQTAEYDTFDVTVCEMESAVDGWNDSLQCLTYELTFNITTEDHDLAPEPESSDPGDENPEIV